MRIEECFGYMPAPKSLLGSNSEGRIVAVGQHTSRRATVPYPVGVLPIPPYIDCRNGR
jgi:hypothetical protein